MRHSYLLLMFLLGLLGPRGHAQVPAWRPFRPGFIYSFSQYPNTATFTQVHTLRVDSAYSTVAGDSVYALNRLLRQPSSSTAHLLKSWNNLFGARLRWRPGTSNYYFEANAEPALGGPAQPVALLLRPRAAVGSTWSASTVPALSATLSSRVASGPAADSAAVITLSNGQQFIFSRANGLILGPQWLTLSPVGATLPSQWQRFGLPQAGLGLYDPRSLFTMRVGDELGYEVTVPYQFGSLACQQGYRLRRVLARQETADSLTFIYQQQDRLTTSTLPGCGGPPGTVLSPVMRGRWAFSLRTGASPQFPFLALLAGEYRPDPTLGSLKALAMGRRYLAQSNSNFCLNNSTELYFSEVYPTAIPAQYVLGLDALAISQTFAASLGLGPTYVQASSHYQLAYYRHGGSTCGAAVNYATLLPSRAALAAATATLHPNPATATTTLTLASPASPGCTLALTDALGRRVWSTPVTTGQTALLVPLTGQPVGLYLVQLLAPNAAPLTWKLLKPAPN